MSSLVKLTPLICEVGVSSLVEVILAIFYDQCLFSFNFLRMGRLRWHGRLYLLKPLKPLDWSYFVRKFTTFGKVRILHLVKSWNSSEIKISYMVMVMIDLIYIFANLAQWYANFLWLALFSGRQNFLSCNDIFTWFITYHAHVRLL